MEPDLDIEPELLDRALALSLDPPTLIRRWWFRHSWGWSSSSVRVRAWGVRRCARLFHYRFLVGPGGAVGQRAAGAGGPRAAV